VGSTGHAAAKCALLFAALGTAAVPVVNAALETGCFAHDGALGALLAVLVPVSMAGVGAALGAKAGHLPGASWGIACCFLVPASGAVVGAIVGLGCWLSTDAFGMGARDGLVFGIGMLAASIPALPLVFRIAHARPGSLTAATRHAAAWSGAGLAIALGTTLASSTRRTFPTCAPAPSGWDPFHFFASAGAVVALVAFGLTWRWSVRGRAACAPPLEQCGEGAHAWKRLDVGLGNGLWARSSAPDAREPPYRTGTTHELILEGDPVVARRSLHVDIVAASLCAFAAVAVAITLTVSADDSLARATAARSALLRREIQRAAVACDGRARGPRASSAVLKVALHLGSTGHVYSATVLRATGLSADAVGCVQSTLEKRWYGPGAVTDETLDVAVPLATSAHRTP
jgi:hypothetical protein